MEHTLLVDQTDQLQQLLVKNAGRRVKLPDGVFNVSTLTVPANTSLTIGPATTLRGLPTSQPLPVLSLSSGVQVTGTGVIDGNRTLRNRGTGIQINSMSAITITGVQLRNIAEQGVQIVASRKIQLTNLRIVGCGAPGVNQHQGINLVISQDIQVSGCYVDDAMHGIQWWGDETNGYCENIRISNNRVRRVTGGIWGNRGRNIIVSNNTTETCSDVGIDFEHSFNCTATGNTVRDCKNYGLAVFYASERITFVKNRVFQGAKYGHGIGLCGEGLSKHISFLGGSINTKGPASSGLVTVGTNVAEDVLLQGLTIVTEGKDGMPIRVLDNDQFQIVNNPLISGSNPVGISLEGSSRSLIQGNTITYRGSDTSAPGYRGGIFVYFRSPEHPAKNNVIRSNTVKGYSTGINDDCWGDVNSANSFEHNVTPNLFHRSAGNTWGGKALDNQTVTKKVAPVTSRQ